MINDYKFFVPDQLLYSLNQDVPFKYKTVHFYTNK